MISANGHIVVPGLNAPDNSNPAQDVHSGVLGVRYYDVIDLTHRIESKVPTTSLSSVLEPPRASENSPQVAIRTCLPFSCNSNPRSTPQWI